MRAVAGGTLSRWPLVTVAPALTSWVLRLVNRDEATGGGTAAKVRQLAGTELVVGSALSPLTRSTTRLTLVPANCGPGPPPRGAIGSPTGSNNRFSWSFPVAPSQRCGKVIRLNSR